METLCHMNWRGFLIANLGRLNWTYQRHLSLSVARTHCRWRTAMKLYSRQTVTQRQKR